MFCWIYKLIHKDATNDDMIYIGSTCNVGTRKRIHKSRCTNPNDNKYLTNLYEYIRENGGWEAWEMIILDEVEVPLKQCEERYKCEDEYIRRYDAINKLNMCYNIRTSKQYYQDNADKLKEWQREYYEKNVDNILKCKKEYYEKNVDNILKCKKEYYQDNKQKIKDYLKNYRESHRETSKKNAQEYRKNNAEELSAKRKEKVCCNICGTFTVKYNLKAHLKTQRCINFVNPNAQNYFLTHILDKYKYNV